MPDQQSWLTTLGQAFARPTPNPNDPVLYHTASPLVNITQGDIDKGMQIGMSAGPASIKGTSGFQALEAARFKAEQDYIKQNLPPPISQLPPVDYIKHYTKNMSPAETLESEALWAKARDLHEARGGQVPFSKSFADLATQVLGRPLTADEATKAMIDAARVGIP